jgi:hypothetical protein
MNSLLHTSTGELVSMTPAEARKADAYLFTKMEGATGPERTVIQRMRDELRPMIRPESQCDGERYRAPNYIPGWLPEGA